MPDFKNSNFKNLEWLQYIITRKLEEFYKQKKQKERDKIWEIAIPIFSLLGTYSAAMLSTDKSLTLKKVIIYIFTPFVFLIFCFLAQKVANSKFVTYIKTIIRKNKIYSLSTDDIECKTKIKEFDNIVCNNILLTYAFIEKYNEEKNINVKIYYYNEIEFYLMESIDKIYSMLDNKFINKIFVKNENEEQKIKKIKIDRLDNLLNMIEENLKFLDERYKEIEKGDKLKTIIKELDSMKIDFDSIKNRYIEYIK